MSESIRFEDIKREQCVHIQGIYIYIYIYTRTQSHTHTHTHRLGMGQTVRWEGRSLDPKACRLSKSHIHEKKNQKEKNIKQKWQKLRDWWRWGWTRSGLTRVFISWQQREEKNFSKYIFYLYYYLKFKCKKKKLRSE